MRSFDPEAAGKPSVNSLEPDIGETTRWFANPRFEGITRLYSARQVVEQHGTIPTDYTVARMAAEQFYDRLRQLFAERKQITTSVPIHPVRRWPSNGWGSRASTSVAGPRRPGGR